MTVVPREAVTRHVSRIVVEPRFVGASEHRIHNFVLVVGLVGALLLVLTPLLELALVVEALVDVLVVVGPTEAPPTKFTGPLAATNGAVMTVFVTVVVITYCTKM